ncbi:MAG: hypothetical protein AMXMBFR13_39800 [Phycisphaerae bacterium]
MPLLQRWIRGPAALLIVLGLAAPAIAQSREAELRRALAWQIALERVGYSPGVIDGRIGPKTELATREFQRVRGLPKTGQLDAATAEALQADPAKAIGRYTIQPQDLQEIGPCPTSWKAKSELKRLGHEALENVIAERFHCATHLLATLNPRTSINSLKAGETLLVPVVSEEPAVPQAARLEVNLAEKVIRAIDKEGKLVGLFHCSVAANKQKLPTRNTEIVSKTLDPWYTFNPEMWPEVKERITRPLSIPPGPRNPVGRCWIQLGLPGYGMHGTPNPELIGKTGSHGCFRLTNWDALRLNKMVQAGTPVKFTDHPDVGLASARR